MRSSSPSAAIIWEERELFILYRSLLVFYVYVYFLFFFKLDLIRAVPFSVAWKPNIGNRSLSV
ncbi:hypothetical protein BDV27DRAFT_137739 [Aspergillus caelatus]|uniref:Uncharacterized protein n=1 Tax=Aspergillus caelatus TaxID=61420 RepID=A0A5N6ZLT6_9EURO|nr:uncharacterized protein BDV27DRAFT_137739 [Aspergillus caelatus]KAE8358435.1 hypothetical protein BDV27DRAFT_137739 [Aspergillus caelatus]